MEEPLGWEESIKSVRKQTEYGEAFDFEVYDIFDTIRKYKENRVILYSAIGLYLAGIYLGQWWMKNRRAFKLTVPLFLWNLGLALFSIVSTIRGYPELAFFLWKKDGIYTSICQGNPHNFTTAFWGLAFSVSKFVELGDTAFIVLRKQKLIALHWFHHLATLIICWFGYEFYDAGGRFFVLNTFVHSFMYSYYAIKALKIHIPKKIAKAITTLQITQMFIFLFMNFSSVVYMVQGRPCLRDVKLLWIVGVILTIFTILFIQFFRDSYNRRTKNKQS